MIPFIFGPARSIGKLLASPGSAEEGSKYPWLLLKFAYWRSPPSKQFRVYESFFIRKMRDYTPKQQREDEMIHRCIFWVYTLKNKNRYKLDQLNFWHAKKDFTLIIELSPTNVYIVSRFETHLRNPQLQLHKNSI